MRFFLGTDKMLAKYFRLRICLSLTPKRTSRANNTNALHFLELTFA